MGMSAKNALIMVCGAASCMVAIEIRDWQQLWSRHILQYIEPPEPGPTGLIALSRRRSSSVSLLFAAVFHASESTSNRTVLNRTRVRFKTVRFDVDSLAWNTAANSKLTDEDRRRDKAINPVGPGSGGSMYCNMCRDHSCCQSRISIATMHDAAPQTMIKAFFADMPIAKESSDRARQPVVLNMLN